MKGNRGKVEKKRLGMLGGIEGGKMWSGYTIWEKNLFSVKNVTSKARRLSPQHTAYR